MRSLFWALLTAVAIATAPAGAASISTKAKQAIVIEYETGKVLLNKNADEMMHPASMTKMMTAYMVFDRLKAGILSLDSKFPVSRKAWRKRGSKMWVKLNSDIRVEDLLRGLIVQSGNDASIVLAEGISGSEEAFAQAMTERAQKIGMYKSTFRNASGWPDAEHLTTAHDLATLVVATLRDFPDYYHYYAEKSFTYSGITQKNRNPLLNRGIGADGLKTGHTEESGYGLAASAKQGERRLVVVVHGLKTKRERGNEPLKLLNWAFRTFDSYKLFAAGETVIPASVWLGDAGTVPLVLDRDLTITIKKRARRGLRVVAKLEEPIAAPIARGTELGKLVVTAPGEETIELPLKAGADVQKLGPFGRITALLKTLIHGGM
jgi:D-alanyl-D-alanine carboxypeptidase (penicillin-binding protein 5/6)